jgi:hypothetical protein
MLQQGATQAVQGTMGDASGAGHDGRRKRCRARWATQAVQGTMGDASGAGHDGRRKRPHSSPHNPRPYAVRHAGSRVLRLFFLVTR